MEQTDPNGTLYLTEEPLEEVINNFYHLFVASDGTSITRQVCPNLEMMLVFNFGLPVRISFHHNPIDTEVISRTAVIGPLRSCLKTVKRKKELSPG